MTRYYVLSTIIHIIILSLLIGIYTVDQNAGSEADKQFQTTEDDSANLDKKIKDIIEVDIKEREQKLDDLMKVVQKRRPELDNEKIKSFSELIISSELENTDLQEITEDNLASRIREYSEQETETLKEEIDNYLKRGKPGISDSEKDSSGGLSNSQTKNSGINGNKNNTGSGGIAENLEGDIDYRGHEINGTMPQHTVSSQENTDLKKRNLNNLHVDEEIYQAKQQVLLSDIVKQKPSKYALLPEEPFEFSERQQQSQDTIFKSLKIGYAPRMNSQFIADGVLDEWDLSRPMKPLNIKNKGRFSAKIYLSWDLENIYLAAQVVDRNPIRARGDWWTANSVEVWFDILNNKQYQSFDSDDFQFWFAPFSPYFGKALGSHKFLGRSIPNYVKKNATGYTVEAVFNQNEELRYLRSYLGKTIGFHFFVNTSIRARDGYEERLFWLTDKYLPGNVHTYTWNNPNSWGDVLFMGCRARIKLEDKNGNTEYNHFGINEWNYIAVYDADRNLDPKTKQLLKIIVHSKDTNDLEEIVLTESDANSGKFVAELFSTTEVAKENDGYLQTTAGSSIEIYYNDQYTANGFSSLINKTYFTYYPIMLLSNN